MCILLQFPSPDDPRPEPPAPSMCLPQSVVPVVTNAVSVLVPAVPSESVSAPFFPPVALRLVA
jgi:hypothetical protein